MGLDCAATVLLLLGALSAGAAADIEDVHFAAIHGAEHSWNNIIASFRAPDAPGLGGATNVSIGLSLLYTRELQITSESGNDCGAVVAADRLVLRNCTLAEDLRSIELSLVSPLEGGALYRFELRIRNRGAAGLRQCHISPIFDNQYFVKTGGRLNTTTPADAVAIDSASDRCCRLVPDACHTFTDLNSCESLKDSLMCLPCGASGGPDLGCPEEKVFLSGYRHLQEEVRCQGLVLYGSVANLEVCAAACNASASCVAFTVLPDGLCHLTGSSCCPGTGIGSPGAVSYFSKDTCGAARQWHAAVTLRWMARSGSILSSTSSPTEVVGGPRDGLVARSAPYQVGVHIASFSATPLPEVAGLVSAETSTFVTVELKLRLATGHRNGVGGTLLLLLAPIPLLPWDFVVGDGVPLTAATMSNGAPIATASVMRVDLPDVLLCVWHRIGDLGGANSIRCIVDSEATSTLVSRSHSIVLRLPVPSDGGFSVDWVLYLEASTFGDMVWQSDVLGFAPVGASITMLMSAVQVPQSMTSIRISFVVGLWCSGLTLTIMLPDYLLRGFHDCEPMDGWPFPVASNIRTEATSCVFENVVTGEPSTEYRLQLASENRGVPPGMTGVFTLSLEWAGRQALVSATEFYNLVEPFRIAGAISMLSMRGVTGPIVIHFETATSKEDLYEGCLHDMTLQVTLLQPKVLAVRSTTGDTLVANTGLADCSELLVETYSDDVDGFPAPAWCRWDSMTSAGHFFAVRFYVSEGYAGLLSGRRFAVVLLAELLDTLPEIAPLPVFSATVLCGAEAVESAELWLSDLDSETFRLEEPGMLGPAAQLALTGESGSIAATIDLLITGLGANAARRLQHLRVVALPLFGFEFSESDDSAVAPMSLHGWYGADAVGAPDVKAVVTGRASRALAVGGVGGSIRATIPAGWPAGLQTLRVSAPALITGLGWTGFAAHPYVFVQLSGVVSGGSEFGGVLQLPAFNPEAWLYRTPVLGHARVVPQSQMGGIAQRVNLLLRLGFTVRGIVVTVVAPPGIAIVGPGPPLSSVTYLSSKGHTRQYLLMPVESANVAPGGSSATLLVPKATLWPVTTYMYCLSVLNPAVLTVDIEWSVAVEFTKGFAVAGGVAPPTVHVEGEVSAADGAFVVVPALLGCSVSPQSLSLGSKNTIQVFFALSRETADVAATRRESRPLTVQVLTPPAFEILEPRVFRALLNLPPVPEAEACDVPEPNELHCQLPYGFAFVAGAAYAFETRVTNPTAAGGFGALRASYSSSWGLRIVYVGQGLGLTAPLLSLCERIPRSPLRGADGELAYPQPFPLYLVDSQSMFFRVSVGTDRLLPYALNGATSRVAVTFQPTSPQLPSGTWLIVTAPVGWQWQRTSGAGVHDSIDGRTSAVHHGTTRDLVGALVAPDASQPNQLAMSLGHSIVGGQVYGFLGEMRIPSVEADAAPGGQASANIWTLELVRGSAQDNTTGPTSVLVSNGNYEAVARSFIDLRIRALADCMLLPLSIMAGAATDFIFGFAIATPLAKNDYLRVLTPPHFRAVNPCDAYFERGVPLPADLPRSGYTYPDYCTLPEAVACSWLAGEGAKAELRLTNTAAAPVPACSYLFSVRIAMPADGGGAAAEADASNVWRLGSYGADEGVLDAPCEIAKPFRLVTPQMPLASADVLKLTWSSAEEPQMLVGFSLQAAVPPPVVVTLRAPFGFRFADVYCDRHIALAPIGPLQGFSVLSADVDLAVLCVAGGAQGTLPAASFAPDASQPAPLLEGVLSFFVPGGELSADSKYIFGISLVVPLEVPWDNTWYLEVGGQVATFPGRDLLKLQHVSVTPSFPGLAIGSNSGGLPYNDITLSFALASEARVSGASLVTAVPKLFHLGPEVVACAPFQNFSVHEYGDVCRLVVGTSAASLCLSGSCMNVKPIFPEDLGIDWANRVWFRKGKTYAFSFRTQNPGSCEECAPAWTLSLHIDKVSWTSTVDGFPLVGSVAKFIVEPTHHIGGVRVLLAARISFAGSLLLRDRVAFSVPPDWNLDPDFCASPLGQAAVAGLEAPPSCTEQEALLTVYEMDLPPLHSLTLQLSLEAIAPSYDKWKARRIRWLELLGLGAADAVPPETPVPLEFAIAVQRWGDDDVVPAATSKSSDSSRIVALAAKVHSYDLLPNMAPSCELQVSTAVLSQRAALRISFRPSSDIDARSNSVLLRASLPYDFSFCQLLWEEEPERFAARDKNDPAFMWAGEPRCEGGLREATLLAVLLDTANKARVTLYVANFTAPAPPYTAAQSSWSIVLQKSRGTMAPVLLDVALDVPGLGAFGRLAELPPSSSSLGPDGFASTLALGAANILTFKFVVAVQVLVGAVVRVVAPPAYTLDAYTFHGFSRHFASHWATSDVWLSETTLHYEYGYDAPSDEKVQVLHVRVLADSLDGEILHFEVSTRNPASPLPVELEVYNRWIVETLDVSSSLVVNSNRMSWHAFEPLPAFVVSLLESRFSIIAGFLTRVDVVLSVDGRVRVPPPPARLALEILAPESFVVEAECFNFEGLYVQNLEGPEPLPFAESGTCEGVGRFAVVNGTAPTSWPYWEPSYTYGLSLLVRNGDSQSTETPFWSFRLVAFEATTVVEAPAEVDSLTIGPAQVVRPANVRLWQRPPTTPPPWVMERAPTEPPQPAVAALDVGTRLLVIEAEWARKKGMDVDLGEAAVLLPEGRFGVTAAHTIRNVAADDAVPASTFEDRSIVIRETPAPGYVLESLLATIGFGTFLPGLGSLQMVVVMQLAVATGFPVWGVQISGPPYVALSCNGASPGSLAQQWQSRSQAAGSTSVEETEAKEVAGSRCRVVRDVLASTVLFSVSAADDGGGLGGSGHGGNVGPTATRSSNYAAGLHFWLSASMEFQEPSGWPAERQDWEASLVDAQGQLRLVAQHVALVPRFDPNATLLVFRVEPTFEGGNGATYIKIVFSIRSLDDYADRSGLQFDEVKGFELQLRTSRLVPFARMLWAEGDCLVHDANLPFPEDLYNSGLPDDCTTVRFRAPLQSTGTAQVNLKQARPAEAEGGGLPARYEFEIRVDIRLSPACQRAVAPCADVFSLRLGEEELFARNSEIGSQLDEGRIGRDISRATQLRFFGGPGGGSIIALTLLLVRQ